MKLCECGCGKEVQNKFSSHKCYWKYMKNKPRYDRRTPKTKYLCNYCGKIVMKHASQVVGNVYCNKQCANLSYIGKPSPQKGKNYVKIDINCKQCGKTFFAYSSRIFCSERCVHTYKKINGPWNKNKKLPPSWNKNLKGNKLKKHYPNGYGGLFKKGHISHNMDKTKDNYKPLMEASQKRLGFIVSYITRKKISTTQQGINIKDWKKFISKELYGEEFNEELKEKIRARDNYRCQECFRHQNELFTKTYNKKVIKYKLNIHHIDYNKINNNSNNLISLCKSCHMQTNYKRNNWEKYFKNKMEE